MASAPAVDTADGRRHVHAAVPMLELHVHRVELPVPRLPRLGRPAVPSLPRPHVDLRSTRGRALWLGGLGGLAVVGVLEWPVAAAVAAGTWVAERRARGYLAERADGPTPEHPAEPEASPAPRVPRARQAPAPRRTARKTAAAGR